MIIDDIYSLMSMYVNYNWDHEIQILLLAKPSEPSMVVDRCTCSI